MTYVKTEWETGDIITAEKLNNLENGVANAGVSLKLTFTEDQNNPGTYVCDHTWQEIYNALSNGVIVVQVAEYEDDGEFGVSLYMVESASYNGESYEIGNQISLMGRCQTPNDYPSYTD